MIHTDLFCTDPTCSPNGRPDHWRLEGTHPEPATLRCYHPHLSHGDCPAGHRIHLDVDHYDQPMWVHCLIADLVQCPHDLEDVTGAALPGKHRVTHG